MYRIMLDPQQNEEDYPDRIECVIRLFGTALPNGGLLSVGEGLLAMLQQQQREQKEDGTPPSFTLHPGSGRTSGTYIAYSS